MTLLERLHDELQMNGAMPFVDFMQLALYAPQFGYYNAGLQTFGVGGDFITAPELTPLFGHTIANQCAQVCHELTNPILFEFGAGSGRLCVDILMRLEQLDALPFEYHILDVSCQLQSRQQQLVQQTIPHLADKIKWLSSWPTKRFCGVIIANEVLDAMPVHRFLKTEEGLYEIYVGLNEAGHLSEVAKPCVNSRVISHVNTVLPHDLVPYQSEVNLFIDDWMSQCHAMLDVGVMFILDYGFPRHEYYHPDRTQGTLMCHYQHLAHANPLLYVGEQDITAHVDFTHVAEAALSADFHVAGYTNQASFLLANGLLSLLEQFEGDGLINTKQAIKTLLQPNEMGELFKVMALTKQCDLALNGFQLHDKRASL
ncbi:MAG: SAM-dependent methyltransferase [Legionellaceae bacterium]|nr:SAM-dependent methyltransferase [Legionellaceae bacterium]